ncbi:aromatic ring-hydroxylating dioxygenase subunit alpha [Sporichthya sp.]|uniref:aromatic ring-hydroxylating oxygenase subunit alpha n=1 Tax=Sporichthya sp. TaxID=65475 RepID=UPI00183C2C67|nr:aromatic ring-hydroxylating dioxygenase subunit alpha [Sporichthya sp.]MBA3741370.1 aromatic ring-hydroxylating dioxygenase subunit alpha [Sporichthya sp.]
MPTMADYLKADTRPVPEIFTERSFRRDIGSAPVPKEPYVSAEYAQLEMDRLWMKVWQVACREREIPNPGDYQEYTIGDQSVLVVRQRNGEIKAHANACIHRGTQLRQGMGNTQSFVCRFHKWEYDIDGTLVDVPCRWDFPVLGDKTHTLSPVRVDTWQGFVFVNFDDAAIPLDEFIGEPVLEHFDKFPLRNRVKTGHVGKWVNTNWKNGLNAFIESYHPYATHPQVMLHAGDCSTQYDLFDWHSRFIAPIAVPSPHVDRPVDARMIIESQMHGKMVAGLKGGAEEDIEEGLAAGKPAREIMADFARKKLSARTGRDYSQRSDTEMLDGVLYFLFPNLCPWLGEGFPLVYRSRPRADLHPEWSLFEVMYLQDFGDTDELPPDVPMTLLQADEPWQMAADQLGALAPILDQDIPNMVGQTMGLRNRRFEQLMYSEYQENICRHFQKNVERFVGR